MPNAQKATKSPKAAKPAKARRPAAKSTAAPQSLVDQLADALSKPRASKERYVGVRNISNYVIGVANPVKGQPDVLDLHSDFVDPTDPTKFLPNPNASQIVPHAVWMTLRRGTLYERGMIMRDDAILGETYEPAAPDLPQELAPGWARNAIVDPAAFIEQKSEDDLRDAIEQMTAEEGLKRLLTAVNMRIEKERKKLGANGQDPKLEERALRNMPAIYHLAEELVLDRLSALGYR